MRRGLNAETTKSWEDRSNVLNEMPPTVAIENSNDLLDNYNVNFHIRILDLSCNSLAKCFRQKLGRSNVNIGNESNNARKKPLNERHVSVPNRLTLKRQAFVNMNLDLCLIAC